MGFNCSELRNAPAQKLFNLVKVEKNCGDNPPRSFADYTVSVGAAPDGVELIEML
jgi:CRISPR-associated protein Csd2